MVERAAQPWTAGTHEGRPKTRDDPRAIDVGISSKATQMTAGIGAHEPLARPRADVQAAVAGLAGVQLQASLKAACNLDSSASCSGVGRSVKAAVRMLTP